MSGLLGPDGRSKEDLQLQKRPFDLCDMQAKGEDLRHLQEGELHGPRHRHGADDQEDYGNRYLVLQMFT